MIQCEKDDEPVLIAYLNVVFNRAQKEKLIGIKVIEELFIVY